MAVLLRMLFLMAALILQTSGFSALDNGAVCKAGDKGSFSGNRERIFQNLTVRATLQGKHSFPGSISDSALILDRLVEETGDSNYFKLTVILKNPSGKLFNPSSSDSLLLVLNPGSRKVFSIDNGATYSTGQSIDRKSTRLNSSH